MWHSRGCSPASSLGMLVSAGLYCMVQGAGAQQPLAYSQAYSQLAGGGGGIYLGWESIARGGGGIYLHGTVVHHGVGVGGP
eukprot:942766-Pyramimonas_sp.AAC.1